MNEVEFTNGEVQYIEDDNLDVQAQGLGIVTRRSERGIIEAATFYPWHRIREIRADGDV